MKSSRLTEQFARKIAGNVREVLQQLSPGVRSSKESTLPLGGGVAERMRRLALRGGVLAGT